MKSHRFSILKKGITIITKWLYKKRIFKDLSIFVVYPFVFYSSVNVSKLTNEDLDGNMTLILVKQQEELLQLTICIMVPLFFIIGYWSLLALLIAPLIFIYFFTRAWIKKRVFVRQLKLSYAIAFLLSETPFYTEAYNNCNYPNYLLVRRVLTWVRYI